VEGLGRDQIYYPGICLEELRKITNYLSEESRCPDQDSKQDSREYISEVLRLAVLKGKRRFRTWHFPSFCLFGRVALSEAPVDRYGVSLGKSRYPEKCCSVQGNSSRNYKINATKFVAISDFPSSQKYLIENLPTSLLTNSVTFSPQANYTDRATAACRRS
jgi:hypothetical protein